MEGTGASEAKSETWSVHHVLETLPTPVPENGTQSPVGFFHMLERLKTTKREGWRRFGIDNGESISDHMYRMSLLTLFAPPSLAAKLDIPRCTKMALIHDMAESLVGDITPVDGISKDEKSRRETATMDYLTAALLGQVHGGLAGQEIRDVWDEYERGETLEAQFVHDLDKMELVLQMVEYERRFKGEKDLGEFSWVAKKIRLPEVMVWCEEVLRERAAFLERLGKMPGKGLAVDKEKDEQLEEYYGGGRKEEIR